MAETKLAVSPQLIENLKQIIASHRQVRSQSISASVIFHEKLAVLTAGSLALAVSGAGLLHQKPLTDVSANHHLLVVLAISVGCLWFSLVGSVGHNFLESYALSLDAKVEFLESTMAMVTTLVSDETIKKDSDDVTIAEVKQQVTDQLKSKQTPSVLRAQRLRNCEMPLSMVAITLFVLGYLSVATYVVILAFSK
jgi:hypothetical protein